MKAIPLTKHASDLVAEAREVIGRGRELIEQIDALLKSAPPIEADADAEEDWRGLAVDEVLGSTLDRDES